MYISRSTPRHDDVPLSAPPSFDIIFTAHQRIERNIFQLYKLRIFCFNYFLVEEASLHFAVIADCEDDPTYFIYGYADNELHYPSGERMQLM